MVVELVVVLAIVVSLLCEIISWLVEVILSLVILLSAIPRATIPWAVVIELVLLRWLVIEGSVLSEILVEISLWWVTPVVVPVRVVILVVWCKSSLLVWCESVVPVLVSVIVEGTALSVVSICVVLLLLRWLVVIIAGSFDG